MTENLLAFVDCETTGLDADRHEVWEVGLILRQNLPNAVTDEVVRVDVERTWLLPVDLSRADPRSLAIGRFHERHPKGYNWKQEASLHPPGREVVSQRKNWVTPLAEFARDFAQLTQGAHLVGAVISFDEERLRKLLLANGACPEWHYHVVDVEGLIAGHLGIEPPWDSEKLSNLMCVDPDEFDRHTALGDAQWAKILYDAVMDAR